MPITILHSSTGDAMITTGRQCIWQAIKLKKSTYNAVLLQPTMVRWMCGVKLMDRLPSKKLRERD